MRRVHHLVAQLVHADQPLVGQPKDQLGAAAPADRVAVGVQLAVEQQPLAIEIGGDILGHRAGLAPAQPAVAGHVDAVVVERRERRQAVLAAEREVLFAGPRRDVYHAGALVLADLVPRHDAMRDPGLRLQLVERAGVAPADQLCAEALLQHFQR